MEREHGGSRMFHCKSLDAKGFVALSLALGGNKKMGSTPEVQQNSGGEYVTLYVGF